MIELTERQRETIRWETVSRGWWFEMCGIEKVGKCRAFPDKKGDTQCAIVGFNKMVLGDYVYYERPVKDGEVPRDPIVCQIVGVCPRPGGFLLSELDPAPDRLGKEPIRTLVTTCRPAPDFKLGARLH